MSNFCLLLSNTLQYLKFRLRYFQNWDVRMFMIVPLHETHPKFAENMENSFDIKIFSLLYILRNNPIYFTCLAHTAETAGLEYCETNFLVPLAEMIRPRLDILTWKMSKQLSKINMANLFTKKFVDASMVKKWPKCIKKHQKFFICIFKISSNSVILPFFSKQQIIFSKLTFFPRPDIFVLEFWIEKHSNYVSRDEKLKSTSFH